VLSVNVTNGVNRFTHVISDRKKRNPRGAAPFR
jgi:hypothetical protein